jgi:GntR family transcriptional regulator
MHIDSVKAIPKVADALMIKEGETVVRIQRVQCAQDQPIAIMTNYLAEELVPGIERHNGEFTSLYAFLENVYGIVLSSAVEHLSAGIADFSEAQILGVPIGSPLLISKRVTYSFGKPAEYAHMKILGDKYEYAVYMEGRPRN